MIDQNKFIRTTAINKIASMKGFIDGVQGGTSAGKTFAILPIEINYACKHPFTETSIVSESVPHLKRGAMKDFKKIMKSTNRWNQKSWNATDSKYTFSNGSYIEFFSADNDSKLRGARRHRLYINEANNIKFEAYLELVSRTSQHVYLDWNPTNPFWFHEQLQNDHDVEMIIINYQDNEACPQKAIDNILKAKEKAKTNPFWANWYKVYGLGQLGSLENVVFSNWKICKFPEGARLLGYGLDFGYTNDPTALISVWIYNGKRILKEEIYKKGLLNSDIYRLIPHKWATIYADSADPKSIDDLKSYGLDVIGATKGADSVKYGIGVMQEEDCYYITECSLNLIKEFRHYVYVKNKPIDAFNHGIDATRYHETMSKGRAVKKDGATSHKIS